MSMTAADGARGAPPPASRPRLSIIVPVFNEEESIAPLYEAIVAALAPLDETFEIIFVDDGSRDATEAAACAIAAQDPRLGVLRLGRNYGQTAAMRAGIEIAAGAYLVTMDGDLQNDPGDIPMMLAKARSGYDLVVGWRMNRQDKRWSRRVPSRVANWLIGKVTGLPIRDNGCSLKVYRAEFIKEVPLYSDMHRFIPAMTIPFGARIAEMGVRHHGRRYGVSKYGLSRVTKVLLDLTAIKTILIFARSPLTAFSGAAALCLILAVAGGVLIDSAGGPLVVKMGVIGLLLTLSVFLVLLGLIAALAFQLRAGSVSRADSPAGGEE